ncbi:sensor histidine kinase [Nonomuraea jiangxiensis]|uniref:histidine kinase n=1 Tax=Nonomuraea jiangxiensis TaxID=633440 RepID=A0A1G8Y4J5_9ACTN|nr:sensor histidine kinase [Nonomuraea jiangxiensis]SDJ97769.1 Signal transduction histidine kinase [Nonomuraea jiangxiensis]
MSSPHGWRPLALDAALAAVVATLQTSTVLANPRAGAVDLVAVLIGSVALVAWRRAPLVPLVVSTLGMLIFSVHALPGPQAAFPVIGAVFGAARAGYRVASALAGAVFLGVSLATNLAVAAQQDTQNLVQSTVLLLGWFMAAGVAGVMTRHRQAYLEQVEQRAVEAERTREEEARRRAGEERLRIARELHDSLTHSISIIKVQAGVAVHLARKRGEEVPAALLAIQEASGDAMRELRATLEVLRDDPGDGNGSGCVTGSGDPDDGPRASGLDRLDDLVRRARSTGLPATVTVSGVRRALPPEVDRAAYRIVQEALTNVAKHAGGARASVRVDYRGEELVVQVDDDGRAGGAASTVPGVGLRGMRERVTALGGRLHAEPRPGGGFTVRAELPLDGARLPAGESA